MLYSTEHGFHFSKSVGILTFISRINKTSEKSFIFLGSLAFMNRENSCLVELNMNKVL